MHHLLVANHLAYKHRRLTNAQLLQRGAPAQNLSLQLRQRLIVYGQSPHTGSPRQHIGKLRIPANVTDDSGDRDRCRFSGTASVGL